ncbi:MAG: tyrosine-type recombinase/integrase family protein [Clostridia bacterium]|nr:tyrosine-type recombinase/integrase family protein [Clostridia bacterium]
MPEEKQKKKYTYQRVSETYNGIRYSARGKSVAEAYRKLQKKIDAAKRGGTLDDDAKVKAWVDTWLLTYVKPRVRKPGEQKLRGTMTEATYREYEQLCRNYIVPEIGNLKLSAVTPAHLQKLLNDHKDMSFSHVSKLSITVKAIFRQAFTDRIIPFDPSASLTLPAAAKGTRRSLTAEEREGFFKAAGNNPHGLLFRFLMATGLRPNELAAVKVGDVDLKQKIVHVTQAVETGTRILSTPKTESGIRYTVINDREDRGIVTDLLDHVSVKDDSAFLFSKKDGGMLTRQAFKVYWKSFVRQWDIEMGAEYDVRGHIYDPSDIKADGTPLYPDPSDPSRPRNGHRLSSDVVTYCLRHTFGTDMQRGNVPIEVTKYLMGHADISTTANIYVDTGKPDAIRAVGILHNEKPVPKNVPKTKRRSKK